MAVLNEPPRVSASSVRLRPGNLRIVRLAPRIAAGGMMACMRDPSGNRASTIGAASSIRRPSGVTTRSIAQRTDCSLENAAGWRYRRPCRST